MTPVSPSSEKAALNVGGVSPPTMSVPIRNQSGSSCALRIQLCRSGENGVPGDAIGFGADSQRKCLLSSLNRICGTKK